MHLAFAMMAWAAISACPASAGEVSAKAAVEKTEVYIGESFAFQVQIEGHDAPEKPDVSGIKDFAVEDLGGQQNSSSSITIVNGQMTRNERKGYIFNYRLTPKREGDLTVPSIPTKAGGKAVATQPVLVRAQKPAETADFKLRMELSEEKCYVGQPVALTVTWYIGKDVEGFEFNLPVLIDERFGSADVEVRIDPAKRGNYLRVPIGGGEAVGEKGRGSLDGKDYLTLRFQKALIPKATGEISIPQGTVACNAVVGHKGRSSRDPFFDDFFNDDFLFGKRKQAVYKKFVIPSNEPKLKVLALPTEGQPAGFAGLVGRYTMSASATPTTVRVGDPITLTVKVGGAAYLKNVELPPLDEQPALSRDFKIPSEMAPGKIEDGAKVFTQTIRAKHAGVKAIPPIELAYFDADKGSYAVARSEPIPLAVNAARVVTAGDAEGQAVAGTVKNELEAWSAGIAHNYEDLSVISDQAYGPAAWVRSPAWWALLGIPPLFYAAMLTFYSVARRRSADPAAREARLAHGELAKALRKTRSRADPQTVRGAVLEALRLYLGRKLRIPPGSLTLSDVRQRLLEGGAAENDIEELKRIFDECEASRYAGVDAGGDPAEIPDRALALARKLEQSLK